MSFSRYALLACALWACRGPNPAYRPGSPATPPRPDATDAPMPSDTEPPVDTLPPAPDVGPLAPDLGPPAPDLGPPGPDGSNPADAPFDTSAGDGGEVSASLALVVESRMVIPAIGGMGDGLVGEDCLGDSVLVGYEITTGVVTSPLVVGLRAACGSLHKSSGSGLVEVRTAPALAPNGNPGTSPLRALCPANEVVVELHGREGSAIDQLAVRCARLVVNAAGAISFEPGATFGPVPSTMGGDRFSLRCEDGWVARGHQVDASFLIIGLGLVCGRPRLP